MIHILLVDDQALIRRGLNALLTTDPDLEVVGEAENGQEAVALVATLKPHVVLMDVRMPIADGVALSQSNLRDRTQLAIAALQARIFDL